MTSHVTIRLTRAQAMAVFIALDATAIAGDDSDALSYYGNANSVAAARRAHATFSDALYGKS